MPTLHPRNHSTVPTPGDIAPATQTHYHPFFFEVYSETVTLSCIDVSHATFLFFFFNDTAPTEIYPLPLHDPLQISEPHRVTALNPGVYRVVEEVVEGDAPRSVTREWRLAAGEALTLRPGDRLILEAGTRVRFEGSKRVPGSAASGVAWAEPPERRSLGTAAHALGAVLTLVGGALALLPRP